MGCNDYYDPVRDRRDERWRANTELIKRSNCELVIYQDTYVSCKECGAMVWTGKLHDEDDLPMVRAHRQWHERLEQFENAAWRSM